MDVTIAQGTFRGAQAGSGWTFKGVPYAAPPVGEARFAAPRPPVPTEGIIDATGYSATVSTPPQRSAVLDELIPDPVRPGDNGLNLNIWTPAVDGSAPVLVWIHGGGFVTGAGSTSAFDGSAFARDGVVAVTINYRLAVEGFAHFADAPANRGLLDQVAALAWVRDNIAAFGGDPAQVTIAGESAGAMSVCTLLAVPAARGLFHRAISQSGTADHVHTPERGAILVEELAAELGVKPTAGAVAQVDPDELHRATNAVITRISSGQDPRFAEFTRLVFQPVIDGELLPEHPFSAISAGAGADVELLIGTNAAEYGLFVAPMGMWDKLTDEAVTGSVRRLGVSEELVDSYRSVLPDASAAELFVAIQSDWFCVAPTDRLVEQRLAAGHRTHVYEFAWSPSTYGGNVGACHTLEIPFVFDTLADSWGRELRGADAPQSVADEVHAAWVGFVSTGEPGWPRYDDRRRVRRFDLESSVVADPGAFRRTAWRGVTF